MIIAEGPDGGGKTRLSKIIAKHFDLEVVAPQRGGKVPTVPVRNRVYRALGKAVQGNKPAKVYDRLYFSELIYGRVLRGEVAFTPAESAFVDNVLLALNAPIIFCIPEDYDLCVSNLKKADQLEGVKEHYDQIYENYVKTAHIWTSPAINRVGSWAMIYDYTVDEGLPMVLNRIDLFLTHRQKREYFVHPTG